MKAIVKGEVYEALPDSNGLIFVHFGNYLPEERMNLTFSMLNFENNILTEVHRDVYKYLKFGLNYEKIIKKCDNYVKCKALILNEGKVFIVNTDGSAYLFDGEGDVMWAGQLGYKNKVPSAVAVCGDGLWGAFSDFDCLVRFNAATMRDELRLGKKGELFAAPKDVFAEDNSLYVTSYGGRKVLKVDLPCYNVTELYTFKEPVYSYVRAKEREFVVAESGLYEI